MLKSKLVLALAVIAAILVMAVGCTPATPLKISGTSPESGSLGVVYSQKLQASGGTSPYNWLISGGALPNGLALKAGAISGTPIAHGSFNFTVMVTDKTGATATENLSITIRQVNLVIVTTKLADAKVGTSYSQALAASGGLPPYRWSQADGYLPVGLTLSGGVISGTPTMAGVFDFQILLTDSANAETLAGLSINVLAQP